MLQKFILFFTLIFLLFFQFPEKAEALLLSPQARISILTIEPGDQLYNTFGHSVIRVRDPGNKIDFTFNYGTFDFDTPNFYLKFIRGKLKYSLSAANFEHLKNHYMDENRSIYEQKLVLTIPQKQAIYNFLENNYAPENRYYNYDFFFDNCATRIRDLFNEVLGGHFHFVEGKSRGLLGKLSFRHLINLYLGEKQWGAFGIDLALGSGIDRRASRYEYMFLPFYLHESFNSARVYINGEFRQAVENERPIFISQRPEATALLMQNSRLNPLVNPEQPKNQFFHPVIFFSLLFLLVSVFTFIQNRKSLYNPVIDALIFGSAGLMGLVILFLWFATDHSGTENNFNLLWACPLHLVAAFLLFRQKYSLYLKWYFLGFTILAGLLLICWNIMPQQLNFSLVPLILILISRSFNIYYLLWRGDLITE